MSDTSKFIADPDYVEMVFLALEQANPNATEDVDFQETWDDEAIQELANYLRANDYDQSVLPEDLYTWYDLVKWTRANEGVGR